MKRKRSIRDRIEDGARLVVAGRERELGLLSELAMPDGPLIAYVHGPHGIGKTALICAFQVGLSARAIPVARLRGGAVEPKKEAFLRALGPGFVALDALPEDVPADPVLHASPSFVILDDADELRLLASWLRRDWIPSLPENLRVVIASRTPPPAAWLAEFGEHFQEIRLEPLSQATVAQGVAAAGFGPETAGRIWSVSGGHPLLFRLALQAAQAGSLGRVAESGELMRAILDESADPDLTRLTEAAAILRRATRPLIAAMLGSDQAETLEAFARLPFVQTDDEGHFLVESMRKPLAQRLSSVDPVRHAGYRRAAATWISSRLSDAGPGERWRYMADLLHLVDLPQVRDAFFPPSIAAPPVEPAEPADFPCILQLVERVAGADERARLEPWIRWLPHRFHVARSNEGDVLAFYVYARGEDHLDEIAPADPLLAFWIDDYRRDRHAAEVLLLRQLIAADARPDAPERAACLLDLKRAYFERWHLSRVYAAASAEALRSPVYRRLGFRPLTDASPGLPGSLLLKLDQGGLIGWVSDLVGLREPEVLDDAFRFVRDRREVAVGGGVVRLTRLEAEVLAVLIDRSPAVIGREEMIETIWKRVHVGSNVVDTVVRSLRKKLGAGGRMIKTVPKSGYFLDRNQSIPQRHG